MRPGFAGLPVRHRAEPACSANFGPGVELLQSFWFVKSDHLGKVSVGLQSQASDNTAILVDGSGSLVPANWVAFDYRAFHLSDGTIYGAAACATMGGAVGDCNGSPQNVIRYNSPTFGGFSVSASWGEDDMWDVAARYAGEFNGFKLAAAAAYNEVSSLQPDRQSSRRAPVGRLQQPWLAGRQLLPGWRLRRARADGPASPSLQLRQVLESRHHGRAGPRHLVHQGWSA